MDPSPVEDAAAGRRRAAARLADRGASMAHAHRPPPGPRAELAGRRRAVAPGAVRDLRRNFPAARIEVLARPGVADLYRAVAEVDAVGARRTASGRTCGRSLRGAFDAAVLLPNSFGTALQAFVARRPGALGLRHRRPRAAAHAARAGARPRSGAESEVYYYRAMLAGVGLEVTASPDVALRCPEEWRARGAALLGDGGEGRGAGPWVGFNPGASFGTAKRWMPRALLGGGRPARAGAQGARVAILARPGRAAAGRRGGGRHAGARAQPLRRDDDRGAGGRPRRACASS